MQISLSFWSEATWAKAFLSQKAHGQESAYAHGRGRGPGRGRGAGDGAGPIFTQCIESTTCETRVRMCRQPVARGARTGGRSIFRVCSHWQPRVGARHTHIHSKSKVKNRTKLSQIFSGEIYRSKLTNNARAHEHAQTFCETWKM